MYRAFFRVLFPAWGAVPDREGAVTLDYSVPTAQWLVNIRAAEIHASVDNTDTYGTPYFTAVELIEQPFPADDDDALLLAHGPDRGCAQQAAEGGGPCGTRRCSGGGKVDAARGAGPHKHK